MIGVLNPAAPILSNLNSCVVTKALPFASAILSKLISLAAASVIPYPAKVVGLPVILANDCAGTLVKKLVPDIVAPVKSTLVAPVKSTAPVNAGEAVDVASVIQ